MNVLSVNIGLPTRIEYKGKKENTGYFKKSIPNPICLGKNGVTGDTVSDLKHHGGPDKACYAYASDHYPFWKERYPKAMWEWGMFGENVTVEGLSEDEIQIGDIFRIGKALVQVSQPRMPCYKMSFRFGSDRIVKEFSEGSSPGAYLRVLEEGEVMAGDRMEKTERAQNSVSLNAIYRLLHMVSPDPASVQKCLDLDALAARVKEILRKKSGIGS